MAIWQFQLHLIPKRVLTKTFGKIPEIISEVMLDLIPAWDDSQLNQEEDRILSKYLSKGKSWSDAISLWGTEESDCVELIYNSNLLAEVSIRLDLRTFNKNLLTLIEEIGQTFEAVGMSDEGVVIQLEKQNLIAEIKKSSAFSFVKDPQAFISRIAEKKTD